MVHDQSLKFIKNYLIELIKYKLGLWKNSGSSGGIFICFIRGSFNTSTSIGHRGSYEDSSFGPPRELKPYGIRAGRIG